LPEAFGPEEYALWFLSQNGSALAAANEALASLGSEPLSEADFLDPANRALFEALAQFGSGGRLALRSALSGDLRRRFDWLESAGAGEPEASEDYVWHDGIYACFFLRSRRLKHEARLLQLAQEGEEDQAELRQYALAVDKTRRQMQVLTRALASRSLLKAKE
jgi:hypothetical protein